MRGRSFRPRTPRGRGQGGRKAGIKGKTDKGDKGGPTGQGRGSFALDVNGDGAAGDDLAGENYEEGWWGAADDEEVAAEAAGLRDCGAGECGELDELERWTAAARGTEGCNFDGMSESDSTPSAAAATAVAALAATNTLCWGDGRAGGHSAATNASPSICRTTGVSGNGGGNGLKPLG